MQIPQWVRRQTGRDGWWEAFQFDAAVGFFGTWAENKLNDYDQEGKRFRHTLDEILADDYMTPDWQIAQLERWGVVERRD